MLAKIVLLEAYSGILRMQSHTTGFWAAIARRPRVAVGMVSAAGLLVGFAAAYFATEIAHCLNPAPSIVISRALQPMATVAEA
jgi:hypothetical protein